MAAKESQLDRARNPAGSSGVNGKGRPELYAHVPITSWTNTTGWSSRARREPAASPDNDAPYLVVTQWTVTSLRLRQHLLYRVSIVVPVTVNG